MPGIVDEIVDEATDAVDTLIQDAEELFPPKPGGLVDKHRKRKAAEEAAKKAEEEASTLAVLERKQKPVRTISDVGDLASAQCVLLTSASPVRRLLPRDDHRRSAVILSVDNDVYITSDPGMAWNVEGAATNAGGFYLPALTPIPIVSTAELYVAATTTASNSRVSVLISRESAA